MALTVSEVARVTGLSVRALHHYDEIGLLRPSGRTEAGYRLYDDADLAKLQQVLFFRELGFPLEEIGRILSDPTFDRREALLTQRRLLAGRRTRLTAMLEAVDAALDALEKGTKMDPKKMFEGTDPSAYEAEAKERWGDTPAYQESARRTAKYTQKDWEQVKAEQGAVTQRLAALLAAGRKPSDPEVQAAIEEHRLVIDRRFYPCSRQMHRMLGEGYVSDPRFTAFYDRVQPGLAQFLCEATRIAAEQAPDGPAT